MIQRIQSIYLFLAAVLGVVFSFLNPYALFEADYQIILNYLPALLAVLISFLAFAVIFLYKNRKLQLSLILVLLMFEVVNVGLSAYYLGLDSFYKEWSFYLVIFQFIFLFLSRKAVKADEELIRSSNRLR